MNSITPTLEIEQNELIKNKDVESCIEFLEDNENIDGNKIAELVLEYGSLWECAMALEYGECLEPAVSNKLALRISKSGDSWRCLIALKYGEGLYPDTIKKLEAVK